METPPPIRKGPQPGNLGYGAGKRQAAPLPAASGQTLDVRWQDATGFTRHLVDFIKEVLSPRQSFLGYIPREKPSHWLIRKTSTAHIYSARDDFSCSKLAGENIAGVAPFDLEQLVTILNGGQPPGNLTVTGRTDSPAIPYRTPDRSNGSIRRLSRRALFSLHDRAQKRLFVTDVSVLEQDPHRQAPSQISTKSWISHPPDVIVWPVCTEKKHPQDTGRRI